MFYKVVIELCSNRRLFHLSLFLGIKEGRTRKVWVFFKRYSREHLCKCVFVSKTTPEEAAHIKKKQHKSDCLFTITFQSPGVFQQDNTGVQNLCRDTHAPAMFKVPCVLPHQPLSSASLPCLRCSHVLGL